MLYNLPPKIDESKYIIAWEIRYGSNRCTFYMFHKHLQISDLFLFCLDSILISIAHEMSMINAKQFVEDKKKIDDDG